ncbi:hypothetical protein K523DRAFT_322806 [Schizophyllum commune Tattone D]|nr:hypothetical protein K523DRAFT_322806 [Schizophyllum commune Tattone D]
MATNKRKRAPADDKPPPAPRVLRSRPTPAATTRVQADEPPPAPRVLRSRPAPAEPTPAPARNPATAATPQFTSPAATKPPTAKKARKGKKGKAAPSRAAAAATQSLQQAGIEEASAEDIGEIPAADAASALGSAATSNSILATHPAIAIAPASDQGQSSAPPSTQPTRTYPRARPRKPDDLPATEDEYFMKHAPPAAPAAAQAGGSTGSLADMDLGRARRPALDIGPPDAVRTTSTLTYENDKIPRTPHDDKTTFAADDDRPSDTMGYSVAALCDPRAWEVLIAFAQSDDNLPAGERRLQAVLGDRYNYLEWNGALQAASGHEPDEPVADRVARVIALREVALEGARMCGAAEDVSRTARAAATRRVPRHAAGVQLRHRQDQDISEPEDDDSSDIYNESKDRDAAAALAGDVSDEDARLRELEQDGNASDDGMARRGQGRRKRGCGGPSAKALGKRPDTRRSPSIRSTPPLPPLPEPSLGDTGRKAHKSGVPSAETVREVRQLTLDHWAALRDFAAKHNMAEEQVLRISGIVSPSTGHDDTPWNMYQRYFSLHGDEEHPDVTGYTREQLLRAASKSFNKRKKDLGLPDRPSREQYEAAFPEVFAFNVQCGLDKAQQVTAESALSRKEFVGVCETATLWAMNVYSDSGYEVFGYVVDSHGRVARFGGSPTYEAMLQDSTYMPNFAQSERDIGTMFNALRLKQRGLLPTDATTLPTAHRESRFDANERAICATYSMAEQRINESGNREAPRDFYARIAWNGLSAELARLAFTEFGLRCHQLAQWRSNVRDLFYQYGYEIRGWPTGNDEACPGGLKPARTPKRITLDQWKLAWEGRRAYDSSGSQTPKDLLRNTLRVVRWDQESRTKDFRQLGDKPIVYDVNDKPLVFVRQSQLFLDDCQAYKFTPDNKLGSRVLPGGNGVDALARMHQPAQMKKTRRAVKRPATPTYSSDDLPSPHFYPMESTKAYEDIEKELRGSPAQDAPRSPSPLALGARRSPLHGRGRPLSSTPVPPPAAPPSRARAPPPPTVQARPPPVGAGHAEPPPARTSGRTAHLYGAENVDNSDATSPAAGPSRHPLSTRTTPDSAQQYHSHPSRTTPRIYPSPQDIPSTNDNLDEARPRCTPPPTGSRLTADHRARPPPPVNRATRPRPVPPTDEGYGRSATHADAPNSHYGYPPYARIASQPGGWHPPHVVAAYLHGGPAGYEAPSHHALPAYMPVHPDAHAAGYPYPTPPQYLPHPQWQGPPPHTIHHNVDALAHHRRPASADHVTGGPSTREEVTPRPAKRARLEYSDA